MEKFNVGFPRKIAEISPTLVLLYVVEVRSGGIPKSNEKEFEYVQKHLLTKQVSTI